MRQRVCGFPSIAYRTSSVFSEFGGSPCGSNSRADAIRSGGPAGSIGALSWPSGHARAPSYAAGGRGVGAALPEHHRRGDPGGDQQQAPSTPRWRSSAADDGWARVLTGPFGRDRRRRLPDDGDPGDVVGGDRGTDRDSSDWPPGGTEAIAAGVDGPLRRGAVGAGGGVVVTRGIGCRSRRSRSAEASAGPSTPVRALTTSLAVRSRGARRRGGSPRIWSRCCPARATPRPGPAAD